MFLILVFFFVFCFLILILDKNIKNLIRNVKILKFSILDDTLIVGSIM